MRDQHELDQWLKQKFDDAQFEFDPAAWEAAEQLINAQDAKRPAWLLWAKRFGILLLVLLISLPIVYWQMNKSFPLNNETSHGESESIVSPENSLTKIQPSSNLKDSLPNSPKIFPLATNPAHETLNPISDGKSSSLSTQDSVQSPDNTPVASTQFDPQPPFSNPQNDVETSTQPLTPLTESGTQPSGIVTTNSSTQSPLSTFDHPTLQDYSSAQDNLSTPTAILPLQSLSFLLGIGGHSPNPTLQRPIHPPLKRHALGITTGSNLSLGLINQGPTRSSIGALPYVGIHYSFDPKPTSPLLRLESGVFLMSRNGLSGSRSFRSVNFGFGFEEEIITLTPKALHALEIPLAASFRVRNRHYVTVGASGSYLIEITTQERLQRNDDFGTSTPDKKNVWGYRKGFNKLDAGAQIGYRYYLGRGFSLNLQGYYGLMDLTDNDFWENDQFDRNMQLRLFLRYDLFQL